MVTLAVLVLLFFAVGISDAVNWPKNISGDWSLDWPEMFGSDDGDCTIVQNGDSINFTVSTSHVNFRIRNGAIRWVGTYRDGVLDVQTKFDEDQGYGATKKVSCSCVFNWRSNLTLVPSSWNCSKTLFVNGTESLTERLGGPNRLIMRGHMLERIFPNDLGHAFQNELLNSESSQSDSQTRSQPRPANQPKPASQSQIWIDPATGLTWQVSPTGGSMEWQAAKFHCAALSLGGSSDWRLPTIGELRSLIRGCPATQKDGSCGATDSCLTHSCWNDPCKGCSNRVGPGPDGAYWPPELPGTVTGYWSSSAVANERERGRAWAVHFKNGQVNLHTVLLDYDARCVR